MSNKNYNKLLYTLYRVTPGFFKAKVKRVLTNYEGGQMYSPTLRKIFKCYYNVSIGYGSYGGCFSETNVPQGVTFGNYCSIAPEIRIFRANHPKKTFTSHPLMYNPIAGYVKEDMLERPSLTIGHDVWIGEWAIILPSVNSIGNGAIIGAGSVVTKDVEPYSIVAGNPAKKIGKRFEDKVIHRLEESEWWLLKKDELIKNIDKFHLNRE